MTLLFLIAIMINIQANLQSDLDLITEWLRLNRMYLHPQKIKIMTFGNKRKLRNKKMTIQFESASLEHVDNIKYLEIILDSQLNWTLHIQYISSKISRSSAVLGESNI